MCVFESNYDFCKTKKINCDFITKTYTSRNLGKMYFYTTAEPR